MKKIKSSWWVIAVAALLALSCSKDEEEDPKEGTLKLNITGLEDLGSDYAYEGWIMVDGAPKTAGIFTVDSEGSLSATSFTIDADDLEKATAYILTIEPSPDDDPAPSAVHVLAGDFSGSSASLAVNHAAALGTSFTSSTGSYILATPTDGGSDTDENSGVWWLDPAAGPGAGLALPELPEGWKYEGWVVVDGTPVTTGKFTQVDAADESAPYSSTTASGPPFPGEDLLLNAPSGLTFPVDLSGAVVVISVEPEPDNSSAPFTLKPLVGHVPMGATDHTLYDMNNNAVATNPTGAVSR